MTRTLRIFRPGLSALEGRRLLAAHNAVPRLQVNLSGGNSPDPASLQVVQTVGVANLSISKPSGVGSVTVRVTTPPSPAVGVVVPPVNQVVTIPSGATAVPLVIPLIANAANPGELDVPLSLTVLDLPPKLANNAQTVEVRVFASTAALPPAVVSTRTQGGDFQITFSKPMDPASVQNVGDYVVTRTVTHHSSGLLAALGDPFGLGNTSTRQRIALKSASYDPATLTVTLVPSKPSSSTQAVTVAAAKPAGSGVRGVQAQPSPLTDLAGNTLNGLPDGTLEITISPQA